MKEEPLISGPMFLAGCILGLIALDAILWLAGRYFKRPYELATVLAIRAIRREINSRYNNLGETPERKILTVMVGAGSFILRYVVLQYLNALSGLLTLSYILFFWPINVNMFTRGVIFGLAFLTHFVWVIGRFNRWIDSEESSKNIVLFLWRLPWQLCGGVFFPLWLLSAISISGDTGLIDTGMGYSLHPLSFIITPLIMVGLYLGDEFGAILGNLWLASTEEREEERPAEPVVSLVESA